MKTRPLLFALALLGPVLATAAGQAPSTAVRVEGEIVDAATGHALPARIYIQGSDGVWHFPQSSAADGSAIRYERQRANTTSLEKHTTLSAHPFRVSLTPGHHTFRPENQAIKPIGLAAHTHYERICGPCLTAQPGDDDRQHHQEEKVGEGLRREIVLADPICHIEKPQP